MKTEKRSLVTWSAFIATLLICIILSACSASTETNEKSSSATSVEETNDTVAQTTEPATASKTIGSMDEFKTNMENSDYYVQKGSFAELDTVDLASKGKLLSCFGNNAGSVYTVLYLPPAPEQDNAKGNPERGLDDEIQTLYDDPSVENYPANPFFSPAGWQYKLRADEALVLYTELPPECKYYSFINYIMFTEEKEGKNYKNEKGYFQVGNEDVGFYHPIFGSIGTSVSDGRVNCDGDSVFGSKAVIVISANQTVTEQVVEQLESAGYSEDVINVMTIPEKTYRMGLEKGKDTFCMIGRISQPTVREAYEKYIEELSEKSVVYRVTPKTEIASNPYENETVIPRGTGVHEAAMLDNAEEHLDTIRRAIIDKYSDEYDYEELGGEIAVPEGLTAYMTDFNAKGDNRDTSYTMTPEFQLNSDEDFIVVYGVNHTATGKAHYSNAVLYAKPMLNGVCSVYDTMYAGTAREFLGEDCKDVDSYYVYKMARTQMDENTKIIEYSTGNEKGKFYGVDNDNNLVLAFRAYVDQTGVGPSYYEIIYDRTIVFHKK